MRTMGWCVLATRGRLASPHSPDVEASSTDKDHSRGNRKTRRKRETGSGTQDDSALE
jgi:hypothetical protein